jgi:hypothetical protein
MSCPDRGRCGRAASWREAGRARCAATRSRGMRMSKNLPHAGTKAGIVVIAAAPSRARIYRGAGACAGAIPRYRPITAPGSSWPQSGDRLPRHLYSAPIVSAAWLDPAMPREIEITARVATRDRTGYCPASPKVSKCRQSTRTGSAWSNQSIRTILPLPQSTRIVQRKRRPTSDRRLSSYEANSGGVPNRSAPVPSTRSAASAIVSSLSSAWAGAVNWRPTGMPAWSSPTSRARRRPCPICTAAATEIAYIGDGSR